MRYVIQYYAASAGDAPPEMECVEMLGRSLVEVKAHAARSIAPGAPYEWAEAYEVMDYDATDDPAVTSWSRSAGAG